MTGYLPRNTQVGDKLRLTPNVLTDNSNLDRTASKAMTGTVIYIHPDRRFATIRFPLNSYDGQGESFRECWMLEPKERDLANVEAQNGRPEGSHGKPGPTIRQQLQSGDWSCMTSDQIAVALGTNPHTITTAIYALRKRGIEIPYIRRGTRAQHAAAGKEGTRQNGRENDYPPVR